MSQLSNDLKWTTAMAVVLAFASTVMTSADSRHSDAVASLPIAYTQYYCYDWECRDFATVVVTPSVETAGPADSSPTWSPDAARVAFMRSGDVVVMDAAAGTVVNITNTASNEWYPSWSPDGQRLAFASDRDGPIELYVMAPDGFNVVRVTTNHGTAVGRPTWSPDSTRVAFSCRVDAGNGDICAINTDGTGFLRLTDHPAYDADPAWSPDGNTVAFTTMRYGDMQLAFMGPDGNGVAPVGSGIFGWQPAWSPDGRQVAFSRYDGPGDWGLQTVRADGTNPRFLASYTSDAAWMPTSLFASFNVTCSGLTCTFDATDSFGDISAYAWNFGDQTSGAGDVVSRTYAIGGQYTIDLTVTDASGATATDQQVISVIPLNQPPVASFTATCNDGLTCLFDWSGSHDPDGWLASRTWYYGGPVTSTVPVSPTAARVTYAAPGSYTATLQVSDNDGASATASQTFTLATPFMHVGDIDRATTAQKGKWSVTVTIFVHDSNHQPVANAFVTASWSTGGAVSCTTNAAGSCTFTKSNLLQKAMLTLTVTNVNAAPFVYLPQGNHDPDGDSNGTTITISK